jgi:hypothetical protein
MKNYFCYVCAYVAAEAVYISLRVVQVKMGYFAVLLAPKWVTICYVCEERMSFV